jgi:CMP-N-acetylneuraminic acid synthetase
MVDTKLKVLALIPARGGSKGIPRKNIYKMVGKPLVAWTIESARNAKLIDRVIVSTDDEEIAEVARKFGAETPFMRPKELAEDDTPDLPVFQHALKWLKENEGYEPDVVVQLWATSPYREAKHIDEAVELLLKSGKSADSVRSVTHPSQTPFKMWRRDDGAHLKPILEKTYPDTYKDREPHAQPRQLLPEVLVQTGYVSVIWPEIIKKGSMHGRNIIPFFHDPELYTEFDSQKDIAHTEHVLRDRSKRE